jgi:hypothetical protein
MRKRVLQALAIAYLAFLVTVVLRADIKYGADKAAWTGIVGVVFLVVLWRLWRGLSYVFFGGRVPLTTPGQNAQFQPPSSRKALPLP